MVALGFGLFLGQHLSQKHYCFDIAACPAGISGNANTNAIEHRWRVGEVFGLSEHNEIRLHVVSVNEVTLGFAACDLHINDTFEQSITAD